MPRSRLTAHQNGERKTLDLADLVKVFGEPGDRPGGAAKPDVAGAIEPGRIEADRDRLAVEVDRLRQERDQARREAGEEREQARQERDRLLGLVEATQKLLEDQSRDRKRGWWRLFGKSTMVALLLAVFLIGGPAYRTATALPEFFEWGVFGRGTHRCVGWARDLVVGGPSYWEKSQWLYGYLTAYSVWVEKSRVLVNTKGTGSARSYVIQYCRANPHKSGADAAEEMIHAFKAK